MSISTPARVRASILDKRQLQISLNFDCISPRTSDLFCRGDCLNAMAKTVEDDREDPFSLLKDSDVEEAAIDDHIKHGGPGAV